MGIKLLPYQKAILKVLNYTDEIELRFNSAQYSKPFSNIAIEKCIQDMKDDFQIQKEKGTLVKTIKNKEDKSMSRPIIELITNECGDWEILRVDLGEDFQEECHSLSNDDWINLLDLLGYEVQEREISDEDMEYGRY